MKKILLTLFLSILIIPLFAQSHTNLQKQIILGLTQYRSEVLYGNHEALPKIRTLLQKLDSLEVPLEIRDQFFLNVSHAMNFKYASPKRVRKWAKIDQHNFIDNLSDEDLKLIAEKSAIFDLLIGGILDLEYPFKIEKEGGIFEELAFYELKNGERIGEIGAGNGTFSLALATIFDSLFLAVNELPKIKIDYISQKIQNCQSIQKNNNIRILKGNKKSPNFEGLNLDKIIMRIALHHFSHKEEMLSAIKKSLKPNGKIFILERPTDFIEGGCSYRLSKKEIIDFLNLIGFNLKKEQRIGFILLMEFDST